MSQKNVLKGIKTDFATRCRESYERFEEYLRTLRDAKVDLAMRTRDYSDIRYLQGQVVILEHLIKGLFND